ncbi:MAG: Lateral flagellin, partial [Pseudomonas stutzeri]|nr:Lateral flagellin [Stutzerimonas stutzeri]
SSFFAATTPTSAGNEIAGTDGSAANGKITDLTDALDTIGTLRAQFGANINRLNHTNNNLANMKDNTEMA